MLSLDIRDATNNNLLPYRVNLDAELDCNCTPMCQEEVEKKVLKLVDFSSRKIRGLVSLLPTKKKEKKCYLMKKKRSVISHVTVFEKFTIIGLRSTRKGDAAMQVRALTVVSLVISLRSLSRKIGRQT